MCYKVLTQQYLHMDKLDLERRLLCLAHIGTTTWATKTQWVVTVQHLQIASRCNRVELILSSAINKSMESFQEPLSICFKGLIKSWGSRIIQVIRCIAPSSKSTTKSYMIYSKTRTAPEHWISEKISIQVFLLKDSLNMLSATLKTVSIFWEEAKPTELPDRQEATFIRLDHILSSRCWWKATLQMIKACCSEVSWTYVTWQVAKKYTKMKTWLNSICSS